MTLTAKRYAKALFDAASPDVRDGMASQLQTIGDVLQDEGARMAVTNPDLPAQARELACAKLAEGAHPLVQNFVKVLLHRRREAVLLDIAPAFHELVLASRGEVEGVLETASALDASMVDSLAQTASKLSGQKVTLRVQENPELIGGVRMRVGNTLFDSSVATAIDDLERKLLAASL